METKKTSSRFVLIELLIVIIILTILLGMLLPALTKTRNRAFQINCVSKSKQIAVGTSLYAGDNQFYYPVDEGVGDPQNYWTQKFKGYVADTNPNTEPVSMLECSGLPPELAIRNNAQSNYMFNFYLNRIDNNSPSSLKNDQIVSPSKTMLFMCGSTAFSESGSSDATALNSRTGCHTQVLDKTLRFPHLQLFQGCVVGFTDNHVETRVTDQVPLDSDEVFWNPRR